ncbi:hypothetical protein TWF694_000708 [Orbilia ellipsospora]|uniref:Methyltransferase type 11 domain-containing protein n=1 Tax=Orbilia ellipsospora TaxID=2528407 RepID=A0AAV9XW17_9PEZI
MLPLSVITGEVEARRIGGSRPPSVGVFDGLSNSPYSDHSIEQFASAVSVRDSTPRYQPRSMPSPPLGYDVTAATATETTTVHTSPTHRRSTSAKLHGLGLNVFKNGLKTNVQSGQRSNPSSPLSKSPVKSRSRSISLLGGSQSSSPNSGHSRHFSTNNVFSEYGPRPPISPTLSDTKSSPSQSPVKAKFPTASHSQQSSISSGYHMPQRMYSNQSSPRVGHVNNLDNWTESYLNNRKKGHKKSPSGRRELVVETLSESSQSDAGSPSYTHMEPQSGGGRAVYHYDLTPESQQGSFPNSPDMEDHSQMREVDAGKLVAPILQARLSSMYTLSSYAGRDTGMWSMRSAAYTSMTSVDTSRDKFASMEESELLELEEMMSDMNSSETSAEKEIRMLMKEMLAGQEVVRTGYEADELEAIPSPQLPQLVEEEEIEEEEEAHVQVQDEERTPEQRYRPKFTETEDWKEIERWAGIKSRADYPRESSVATYDRSEIDDESMHDEDFARLEMEAAMSRISMRSSRHPAEYEGLNEMGDFDVSTMPEIQIEVDISTPKQQYPESIYEEEEEEEEQPIQKQETQEQTVEIEEEEAEDIDDAPLGYDISFEDLDIVDEEMKFEEEAEVERIRQEELLKAAALILPESRPGTNDGKTGLFSRPGLPQLSLLAVPSGDSRTRATLESPTSGEESPLDVNCKGKGADLKGGRRHNLKDNEIRVEDPAYLTAFKKFLKPSVHSDAFICRQTRFDAFQTRRICNELPHEYRPLPPPPPKIEEPPAPVTETHIHWRFDDRPKVSSVSPEKRRAKEVQDEINSRLWVFMAAKWLHYGRILISPAHDILTQAGIDRKKNRNAVPPPIRRRVLDLGGAPVADWGWHCAYEYPHSKVYTVTSRPKNINIDNVPVPDLGVVEKRRFTGPSNHRHIKVSSLWKLPFPDNHFDVVSARSLQTILKQTPPPRRRSERRDRNSKTPRLDEYSLTLKECYRVLKPCGHFEWSLTDSDVIRPGPATEQLNEEFAQELRSRGYDPHPTERWISRLANTGFVHTKRTWTILPMAPPAEKPKAKRRLGVSFEDDWKAAQEEMQAELKAWEELGIVKGNTQDVAALTGIVGTWRWEEWMVKLDGERETPAWKKGLVNGITASLDEGREAGSGWRNLVGWTRKPTLQEKARKEKKMAKYTA